MSVENVLDPVLFGLALIIYLVYHVYLYIMIRRYPLKTASGQVWLSRKRWVEVIMEGKRIIEGVQTVRNSIMSTSVLATTSLALSGIVVALVGSASTQFTLDQNTLLKSPAINNGWRFFTVIVFFSCAFFCYMQSIRAGNHGSFLIAIPRLSQDEKGYSVTPAYVAKVLNRGAMFFTIGTRFFYLAFISMLWLWGPIPPLVATLIIVPILYLLDRYPDPHYHKRVDYRHDMVEA